MRLEVAAHEALREAKGGIEGFVATYGMKYSTFAQKLNPHDSTVHITIIDLIRICQYTGDTRMLSAFCDLFGATWTIHSHTIEGAREGLREFVRETGESVNSALGIDLDNPTPRDLKALEALDRELDEDRVALNNFQHRVKSMIASLRESA